MPAKAFIDLLLVFWGTVWTGVAYAQSVYPESLQALPWVSVLIAGGMAMWGGLVVTVNRLDAIQTRGELMRWLIRDLIGAAVAGWFIYFVGQWAHWNVWLQALSLVAAGYGGSKVLEVASKRLIKLVKDTE